MNSIFNQIASLIQDFQRNGAPWAAGLADYKKELLIIILSLGIILYVINWVKQKYSSKTKYKWVTYYSTIVIIVFLSLFEFAYVSSLGNESNWFIKPSQTGWLFAIVNFLVLCYLLYTQIRCFIELLNEINYDSATNINWKFGLYSWAVLLPTAFLLALVYENAVVYALVLFTLTQIIQAIIAIIIILPRKGVFAAFIASMTYLIVSFITAIVLLKFIFLLVLCFLALFLLGTSPGEKTVYPERTNNLYKTCRYCGVKGIFEDTCPECKNKHWRLINGSMKEFDRNHGTKNGW